ncbi:hypothetical protein AJ79_03403 [Helicocarpus griseus UAMH5409]|uniref:Altered inheritance of mitochondria protein 9, mitochondrial n=1 Tax=Helicocarpus griseus UAMH5409 TaxID=1447875 RepID=A0A2B7XY16_9EURO|nr:hypothetical protein AJ79_03403 [Helicocarpus griseus UAMH5409]
MKRRHVQFNLNKLAEIAAKAVGASQCVKVEKCLDGLFNKAYIFTLNNGKEVVGKVPNPNAGMPHFTTASEVATMDFVRNVLRTPVPEVYTWSSRADGPVGPEYIIMEKLTGIPLAQVWQSLDVRDRVNIAQKVLNYQKRWTTVKISRFGSLYYSNDVSCSFPSSEPLYIEEGQNIKNDKFAIGPSIGREWIDEGKSALSCERGPWSSVLDYHRAAVPREKAAAEDFQEPPKQLVVMYISCLYVPTRSKKLAAINSYSQILPLLLPSEQELNTGHLWHDDLHYENVYVNPERPTETVGIIDWKSVEITPLYNHSLDPDFLGYEGPEIGDDLARPVLNTKGLDQEGKKLAIKKYHDEAIMIAWRMLVRGKNPAQYRGIQFRNSTAGHLLNLAQNISVLGEAHFRALLLDIGDEWSSFSNKEFPLRFSAEEIEEIRRDMEGAAEGIGF